jgi:hypothetical protein
MEDDMSHRWALCIVILAVACTQRARGADSSGGDAAVVYKQAFATLPQDPADRDLLDRWQSAPFDAASLALLAKCQPALDLLAKAAAIKECDWKLNYEQGLALQLPYLGQARLLAEAASFKVRQLCAQRKFDAAGKLAADVLRLARQIETQQVLVARLVGFGLEQMIAGGICRYLPEFPAAASRHLSSSLAALPAIGGLSATWMMEGRMAAITIHRGGKGLPPQAVAGIPKDGPAREALAKEIAHAWEQAARVAEAPLPDALKHAGEVARIAQGVSASAQQFLSDFDVLLYQEARAAVLRDLFATAVDMQANGRGALASHADPFGAGPFTEQAIEGGIRLQSALIFKDKPVALTTGLHAFD